MESPSFQGARPLWSRLKRRPVGPGAGMQSADQPPTPDAILSPHRLSGFRTRAPLRRSGNRPVRTVGRNGSVCYMWRIEGNKGVLQAMPRSRFSDAERTAAEARLAVGESVAQVALALGRSRQSLARIKAAMDRRSIGRLEDRKSVV